MPRILLYFVIKDHPFADGNKRIGTLLFLEQLLGSRAPDVINYLNEKINLEKRASAASGSD